MTLKALEIESATPNEWTGKLTSLVYETEAQVADWLARRGHLKFEAADDEEEILIRATERSEDEIRDLFRGASVTRDQGLLYPALGAYDSRGRLLKSDTAPAEYLEGIRLLCEVMATPGAFMPNIDASGIAAETTKRGSITYRLSADPASLAFNHPDIWKRLKVAVPYFV